MLKKRTDAKLSFNDSESCNLRNRLIFADISIIAFPSSLIDMRLVITDWHITIILIANGKETSLKPYNHITKNLLIDTEKLINLNILNEDAFLVNNNNYNGSEANIVPLYLVENAALLFDGEYAREGFDLVITGGDGEHLTISDYFSFHHPPTLILPNGSGLSAKMVRGLLHNAYGDVIYAGPADGLVKVAISKVSFLKVVSYLWTMLILAPAIMHNSTSIRVHF